MHLRQQLSEKLVSPETCISLSKSQEMDVLPLGERITHESDVGQTHPVHVKNGLLRIIGAL